MLNASSQNKKKMSFFTVLFVNDKSHLKLTAAVKVLL